METSELLEELLSVDILPEDLDAYGNLQLFKPTPEAKEIYENLPRMLASKEAKYLKAIRKSDLISFDYDENDENIDWSQMHHYYGLPFGDKRCTFSEKNKIFDDSIVINTFQNYIKPEYSLNTYLDCAETFLRDYFGLMSFNYVNDMAKVYSFILAHARDYDDPTKDMFQFSNNGTNDRLGAPELQNFEGIELKTDSTYVNELQILITDLRTLYSEQKYQKLNLNITYLVFITVRGLVKTHSQLKLAFEKNIMQKLYKELCPHALDKQLPTLSDKCTLFVIKDHKKVCYDIITLILYSFKNKGLLTRRILTATCMQYFRNNGLAMYMTFNKVVELYNVNERELWDYFVAESKTISSAIRIEFAESLSNLADFCHSRYEGENDGKTFDLFPYCRLLDDTYHVGLSPAKNLQFTYTLTLLVDMKLGFQESFMRKASWANYKKYGFSKTDSEKAALRIKAAIESSQK